MAFVGAEQAWWPTASQRPASNGKGLVGGKLKSGPCNEMAPS